MECADVLKYKCLKYEPFLYRSIHAKPTWFIYFSTFDNLEWPVFKCFSAKNFVFYKLLVDFCA